MGKKRGRLIVFEGADGSGKTTQAKLLFKHLKKQKIPTEYISFPIYESTWGKLVRRYLDGEFGDVGDVSPYLACVFYAGDRLAVSKKISRWLSAGKVVVCDRYTGSNIAHQAAKIKDPHSTKVARGKQNEREKFVQWLEKFEYEINKIPREDKVILLSVPVGFSQKLMRSKKKDIHERNKKYLSDVVRVYEELEIKRSNWEKIECVEDGNLLSREEIHEKVSRSLDLKKDGP